MDKQIITLKGKSIVEYFEQAVENKKLKDKLYAKEQECEEINLTNERLVDEKYKLNEQIHQLKFENKVLKQYKSSKQASYEEIQNLWNIVELKNRKLSQTITEIKEIAEANKKYIYVLPSYFVAGDSLEFSFGFIKKTS